MSIISHSPDRTELIEWLLEVVEDGEDPCLKLCWTNSKGEIPCRLRKCPLCSVIPLLVKCTDVRCRQSPPRYSTGDWRFSATRRTTETFHCQSQLLQTRRVETLLKWTRLQNQCHGNIPHASKGHKKVLIIQKRALSCTCHVLVLFPCSDSKRVVASTWLCYLRRSLGGVTIRAQMLLSSSPAVSLV